MLGYLRFSLALLVAMNHLWILGGVGRLAVFSFYVISGYLMTTIIQRTYGTSTSGILRYGANRALRIYPAYLIVFVTVVGFLCFFGRADIVSFDPNLSVPATITGWFMNVTLLGLDFSEVDRTIPPSWTLFVELSFYLLIPLLLKVDKRLVLLWLLGSVLYHLYGLLGSSAEDATLNWNFRYGTVAAGSLGFAIGAASQLYLPRILIGRRPALACFFIMLSSYLFTSYWALTGLKPALVGWVSTLGFYGCMFSTAPVVCYLSSLKISKLSERVGEYSYPFYLVHIPAGFFAYRLIGGAEKTLSSLVLGVFLAILISGLIVRLDRMLVSKRNRNRSIAVKANVQA